MINLLDQKEPSFELKVDKGFEEKDISNFKPLYFNKIIKPSEKELKLHKEFLKKEFKKNFFN